MSGNCRTIRVRNRLGELMRRPGGILRTQAIETATQAVETLREEFVNAIPDEIERLETMVARGKGRLSQRDLEIMLEHGGRLLTLSGTFGYDLLDQVVKRFCDFVNGMVEKNVHDAAPVEVHLRAMRLVCPGAAELTAEEAGNMLNGLEKVHRHYGIARSQPEAAEAADEETAT